MADIGLCNNDYFHPGNIVKCVTRYNMEVQGEVMTFDKTTGVLLLKKVSSSGRSDLNNVSVFNMKHIANVEVIRENNSHIPENHALNAAKLKNRFREAVKQKQTLFEARRAGVNEEGVELYNFLKKVFPSDTVKFRGQDIQVLDEVLIKFPYQNENCAQVDPKISNKQCITQVKSVVDRFHNEERTKSRSST